VIPALWIAFALYWVLAAVRQRRAKQDESLMARLLYVVLAVIAFLFLLDKKESIAALWILLGLYAAFVILRIRGAKQRQSLFTRLPHVGAMIVAFVLLLERQAHFALSLSKTLSADTNPPIWKTVLRCFKQTWILDQLLAESQIGQCK
jgi:hypothetical protein